MSAQERQYAALARAIRALLEDDRETRLKAAVEALAEIVETQAAPLASAPLPSIKDEIERARRRFEQNEIERARRRFEQNPVVPHHAHTVGGVVAPVESVGRHRLCGLPLYLVLDSPQLFQHAANETCRHELPRHRVPWSEVYVPGTDLGRHRGCGQLLYPLKDDGRYLQHAETCKSQGPAIVPRDECEFWHYLRKPGDEPAPDAPPTPAAS